MKPKIIVIRETFWQSVGKDLVTGAMLVSATGIGWLLRIEALEWVGAVLFIMWACSNSYARSKKMTVEEARTALDDIEAKMKSTPQGEAK